jgi:GNAT superfamily N-acetyltransferase
MLLVSGPNPDSRMLREATEELRNWAHSLGLAACTIRLHPLLDANTIRQASEIWQEKVRVFPPSQTTAVELERWDETRFALQDISKGRQYDLKRARAACRVRVAEGPQASADLIAFQAMYRETMARLHADKFFFFPDEYYQHLADELGDSFAVAMTFAGDRPVGSAVFLAGRDFGHYHLSGTNDEGRRNGAATLLLMAGCEWARRKGCSLLHMGGGSQPDDSLWQFKRSFHGKVFSYSYISVIANDSQYKSLASNTESPWPYAPVGRASENVLV